MKVRRASIKTKIKPVKGEFKKTNKQTNKKPTQTNPQTKRKNPGQPKFYKEHPEFSTQISVEDKVLPENSRLYQIQNGSVTKSTGENENCRSKPAEILQKMPISGGKVLKIAVVSRQH